MTIIGQLMADNDDNRKEKTTEEINAEKAASEKAIADKKKRAELKKQEQDRRVKQAARDGVKQGLAEAAAQKKGKEDEPVTPPKAKENDGDGNGVSDDDSD